MHSYAESVSVRDVIDDSIDASCTRVGEQFVSDNIGIQNDVPILTAVVTCYGENNGYSREFLPYHSNRNRKSLSPDA